MTELTILIGRRRVPDGPLMRVGGRCRSNLANFKYQELMVTDCKRYQLIKRYRNPDRAFSLYEPDLAIPSQGLDPTVDWHVYVKATSYTGAVEFSNAYRFPHDQAIYISEGKITDIKGEVLRELRAAIAQCNEQLQAMDRSAARLDAAAVLAAPVPGLAERVAELSAEIVDRMAATSALRDRLSDDLREREREYGRRFGKKRR